MYVNKVKVTELNISIVTKHSIVAQKYQNMYNANTDLKAMKVYYLSIL